MKQKYAEKTAVELNEELKKLKVELFNLRFQQATGALTNPMQIRDCKRNIARVQTILRQLEIKALNA